MFLDELRKKNICCLFQEVIPLLAQIDFPSGNLFFPLRRPSFDSLRLTYVEQSEPIEFLYAHLLQMMMCKLHWCLRIGLGWGTMGSSNSWGRSAAEIARGF